MEVEKLVEQVRSLMSEFNSSAIKDERDVLPALNRGQKEATSILARKYDDLLIQPVYVRTEAGVGEYYLPPEAFEDRLQKVDCLMDGSSQDKGDYLTTKRLSYKQLAKYEGSGTTRYPLYYCVIGRKYRLVPVPSTETTLRLMIVKTPEDLVLPYGRIVSLSNESVIVDSIRNNPGTGVADLSAFANVIDSRTGRIKGTVQMSTVQTEMNRIKFSTNPTRTKVLGKNVTSLSDIEDIELDDFICPIGGTCVMEVPDPVPNFVMNWAKEDLEGSLGDSSERIRREFEARVSEMGLARETSARVIRTKQTWRRGGLGYGRRR